MKKVYLAGLVLTALLALSALTSVPEKHHKANLPDLPAYDNAMEILNGTCSCSSLFVSCYQECDGSNCQCFCNLFSCYCTRCGQLTMNNGEEGDQYSDLAGVSRVSVSEEQYSNFVELATILRESDSEAGHSAYLSIYGMIKHLKEKEYADYLSQSNILTQQLGELPESTKTNINRFLDLKDAGFRI